jgi:hypothetical protein
MFIFSNLAALWNLLLFLAIAIVLIRFFYAAFLRKWMRVRRIAHIRERRALREASQRQ